MVQPDRLQMALWRMRIACWITKTTDAISQYVIIIAFPLQQLLEGSASILRYTHVVCLLFFRGRADPSSRGVLPNVCIL
jgi:hypothetical protein